MAQDYGIPAELLKINDTSSQVKKLNILLIGEVGSGKTTMSVTGPKPVYYYGLDLAGSDHLAKFAQQGWLVRDTRFQNDDPQNPTVFARFAEDLTWKIRNKTFHSFGSVIVDSGTGLMRTSLAQVLKERNRAGGVPSGAGFGESDYSHAQNKLKNVLYQLLMLPCTVILTAHVDIWKQEATDRIFTGVALTGQLKKDVPGMFGEVYYMMPELTPTGMKWQVITQFDGTFNARSSIGRLAQKEPANIMTIMQHAGLKIPDIIPPNYYTTTTTDVTTLKEAKAELTPLKPSSTT